MHNNMKFHAWAERYVNFLYGGTTPFQYEKCLGESDFYPTHYVVYGGKNLRGNFSANNQ